MLSTANNTEHTWQQQPLSLKLDLAKEEKHSLEWVSDYIVVQSNVCVPPLLCLIDCCLITVCVHLDIFTQFVAIYTLQLASIII